MSKFYSPTLLCEFGTFLDIYYKTYPPIDFYMVFDAPFINSYNNYVPEDINLAVCYISNCNILSFSAKASIIP